MKKLVLVLFCCLIICRVYAQTNNNLVLRGHVAYSKPISNLWGYVDSLGNEYALVGTWNGVSIVNVTNPDSPKVVKNIPSVHPFNGQTVTREVKTWKTFAYSTNDNQTDSGLLIIDLSHLPDTNHISYHQYISHGLTVAHTLWVDEHGILYVYGFDTTGGINNLNNRGAMVFDLNQDPYNPRYVTEYTTGNYIHDGFVRGDTLWACEIYSGWFAMVNVKDTSSFKLMAKHNTISHYTHNAWPNSNNHCVFTTDEQPGSYLQSYNVSDLNNITLLDTVQSNPGSGSTVHNVHLLNDTFAVTSYYTDGVVIFDVSHPDNIIEVGNYDTSPLSGPGLNGCWGVYPFLPSHNIIASDIQQGLFVFSPRYKMACLLEGNVTDSSPSLLPLNNVIVKILPSAKPIQTNIFGNYKTGIVDSGKFDVQFFKYGYITKTIHGVSFQPGVVTILNVQLRADSAFNLHVLVTDSFGSPVKNAKVWITDNSQFSNTTLTNENGNTTFTQLYNNTYDIYAGAWGYKTIKLTAVPLTVSSDSFKIKIGSGYYDDFTFDLGWQSTGTAVVGLWVRTAPSVGLNNGLPLNPTLDVADDISNQCYLTGNQAKNLGVQSGTAVLTSPAFDLSTGIDPNLKYYRWFTDYNSGKKPTDSLVISLSNGDKTVPVEVVKPGKDSLSMWIHKSIRIKDFLPLTANMHLTVTTSEVSTSGSDVVAALDKFEITDSLANAVITLSAGQNRLEVYPNPFSNTIYLNNNLSGLKSIEVFNLLGEMVYKSPVNSTDGLLKLNLSSLSKGVYFIRAIASEGIYSRMIIKE